MSARELVDRFFHDLMSRGVLAVADEIAADVYIEHAIAPFGREAPGAVPGPGHLRDVATWLREQFPDLTMSVDMAVEQNDLIAALVRSRGTNLGALNAMVPPTGRAFDAHQSHWLPDRRRPPCRTLGNAR